MEKSQITPTHLGFIVDGNRRWAKAQGLTAAEGHEAGFSKVEEIAEAVIDSGVKYVSFYLFSTENWQRSEEEVDHLMRLAERKIISLAKRLAKKQVALKILGRHEPIADSVWQKLKTAEKIAADDTNGTVCACFNYGGQQEIADAATKLLQTIKPGDSPAITPDDLKKHLYHPEIPPVDMVIRTSGEQRLSNFMLWRVAYAELLFLEQHFPALEKADVEKILSEFAHRSRRFGK